MLPLKILGPSLWVFWYWYFLAEGRFSFKLKFGRSSIADWSAVVQERLDLSEAAEVEEWLVRAIGKKLIEGQMDQVQRVITITKSSFSTFGPQQWQLLHRQLAAWKVRMATCY